MKSRAETPRQEDNINLTNPIPVLAHRLLQDELTIGKGTVITLSFPSYKETGKQRYDLTLEIVDFFTNFPSIKATPSLMVDDASLEIPIIIPMPILNTLITTIDLPASEQNEFLLLTVKEENKINDVTQDIISRFSYIPTITVQKRLTSRELDQVLPQLDIYESMRTNQMLQIEVAVIIIVIFFFFILHFRQWINRYESLALLFGATSTSLKREYLIEITFYMISIIILAELTVLFLAVVSNGISALTFNTFLEQVLRLFIPILAGTILMTIVLVSFILTRPIKITKATLPRFTR